MLVYYILWLQLIGGFMSEMIGMKSYNMWLFCLQHKPRDSVFDEYLSEEVEISIQMFWMIWKAFHFFLTNGIE